MNSVNFNLTLGLMATVKFNNYNFVTEYDKYSIFTEKSIFTTKIENQVCKITLNQTTNVILRDYSILNVKNQRSKIKFLISNRHIPLIPTGDINNEDWQPRFLKLAKTSQRMGPLVKEACQRYEYEVNTFKTERKKIESKSIQAKACQKADELVTQFCSKIVNLDEEMEQCGLSSADIELIKKHAGGIYEVTDFFQRLDLLKLPKETTIIGLHHKDIIPGVRDTLECEDYMDAYMRIFNDFRAKDDFLEKLTKETRPIIFLVPHKLFGSKKGVTAGEMEWLLKNPDSMANIHFVFRSYKTYSLKVISTTGLKDKKAIECYTEQLTLRIFQQIKANLGLPEVKEFDPQPLLDQISIAEAQFECAFPKPFEKSVKIAQFTQLTIEEVDDFIEETQAITITKKISLTIEDLKTLKVTRAIFLIGGSGAGKEKIRNLIEEYDSTRKYVIIDPDLIKVTMLEYQEAVSLNKANAANDVHEASVRAATQLLEKTIQTKQDFIYDSTGSRFWIYEEQMAAAKKCGMFVELIYVETTVENCLKRAELRAKLTGRVVPEQVIRSSNRSAKLNFEDLQLFAHRSKKYNNDGSTLQLQETIKQYRKIF